MLPEGGANYLGLVLELTAVAYKNCQTDTFAHFYGHSVNASRKHLTEKILDFLNFTNVILGLR